MKNLVSVQGVFLFFQMAVLLYPPETQAGNKKLIKQEIKKMDTLNKKVVTESVEEMPQNGVIQTQGKVFYKEGEFSFEVTGQKVSPVKEETIHLDNSDKKSIKGGESEKK